MHSRILIHFALAYVILAVSNGNTVGVIPYFLNGGISSYTPLIRLSYENIVSARLITADSEVIEATELENPELL